MEYLLQFRELLVRSIEYRIGLSLANFVHGNIQHTRTVTQFTFSHRLQSDRMVPISLVACSLRPAIFALQF